MSTGDSQNPSEMPIGECIVPPPMSPAVAAKTVLKRIPHEEERIRTYVELEAEGETVTHLEKVATESIYGHKHDAWDVHTDRDRYWAITEPTNLYSQAHYPSLDYTLSFHIGLMARVNARRSPPVDEEQQDRLATAWRRWMQAAEALDEADEAEDFQAVGMRCRECLIAFARSVGAPEMVGASKEPPKRADFVHWAEIIADFVAGGRSAAEVRGYLKSVSRSAWLLVNWLTHAANASRFDGEMAVGATANVLQAFGMALVRHERGAPDRCPSCTSYRLRSVYEPALDVDPPYLTLCESCGWTDIEQRPANHNESEGPS